MELACGLACRGGAPGTVSIARACEPVLKSARLQMEPRSAGGEGPASIAHISRIELVEQHVHRLSDVRRYGGGYLAVDEDAATRAPGGVYGICSESK